MDNIKPLSGGGNVPIKYLQYKDADGLTKTMYGITILDAVFDENGQKLSDILQNYDCELGSNENGSYAKFGNGLLICWYFKILSIAFSNSYASMYQANINLTFPHPFIGVPVAACGQFRWSSSASWGQVVSTDATTISLRGLDYIQRPAGDTDVMYIAIGKWK